uniref:uncharacterized protein LOC105352234 n=1 Tax=Fragaria vesca subsp. vesca TaxID=101020 RepID=UPI0005CA5FF4|nr:PREDICTED: uncharacterized protein LOC105352234 [Fragaria vesca subsp. vesca]
MFAQDRMKLSEFALTAKETFNYDFRSTVFEKCEKIFIPLLDKGIPRNHWFLMVIKIPSKEVEIWDSLPCRTRETARNELASILLKTLDIMFEDEIYIFFHERWLFSSFKIFRPGCVPVQPNDFDCGIYTIKFMEDFENASKAGDKVRSYLNSTM